jgi:Domain of unknown function (DUF4331)
MSPDRPERQRRRQRRTGIVATAVGAAIGVALVGGGSAQASSHREAPLIAGDPKADNTDVYAFVSPDKPDSVTLIANWIPFEEPNGGPNFYPFQDGAHYDINIDNNGDAKADIIYRWKFSSQDSRRGSTFLYNNGPVTSLTDPNLLFRQTYTLTKIVGKTSTTLAKGVAAPSDVGEASMPNYAALRKASITSVKGGGKSFAGQADDSFFLDLRVFDLLYGGDLSEAGHDTLKGYNVNSIALQVPKSALALRHNATRNPVIGIWSTTSKQTLSLTPGQATGKGSYVQVSRLGNPLVNEVVIPTGLKDAFNSLSPDKDATIPAVVKRVTNPELPKLIQGIYGIPAPKTPRNDLVEIFLTGIAKNAPTLDGSRAPIQADLNSQILNKDANAKKFRPSEMLRLNTAVAPTAQPNRLGVIGGDLQGYPNGRRLADDVLDISVHAVEGSAVTGTLVPALAAGDGVDRNDNAFGTSFPYLALPNTSAVNTATDRNGVVPPIGSAGNDHRTLGMSPMVAQAGSAGLAGVVLSAGLLVALRRRRLHPGVAA